MSGTLNPLFHPKTIARHLARTPAPPELVQAAEVIAGWIEDLKRGTLDKRREISTDQAFMAAVFGKVLGYRLQQDWNDGEYDLGVQVKPGLGSKAVDGAIGWFSPGKGPWLHAVLEMKRATQDLDAGGSGRTPVEQAWGYANDTRTVRWILVSNFREIRLYCRHRSTADYERFLLTDLAEPRELHRLWLLLSRDHLLPSQKGCTSLLDHLLDESEREQKDITDRLYKDYAKVRRDVFDDLCRSHPNIPAVDHVGYTQKILDRFLFVAFAEDRGLLTEDGSEDRLIERALKAHHDFLDIPVWDSLKALSRQIDQGDPKRGIPKLNGGLFAPDEHLDALEVPDETCRRLGMLAAYDFREDVSVEVLGHIFEQSISDLEELRAEARGEKVDDVGSRKRQGVFYTPDFVTRYLADATIGKTVLALRHACAEAVSIPLDPRKPKGEMVGIDRLTAELAASTERVVALGNDPALSKPVQAWEERLRVATLAKWEGYQRALRQVRVLDPACGSGAFLVAAFDLLAREYRRADREIAALGAGGVLQSGLYDVDETVLHHNLFGVDLNHESVEITKLSLWIKTATRERPLTWLDGNLQVGDSVVSDPTVSPRAFDWSSGHRAGLWFDAEAHPDAPDIHARWRDGFDVVLGNPPYVRQEWITALKPHLKEHYDAYDGVADLFVYFFERGLKQLAPGGRLGFIVANKWLKGGYAEGLRGLLASRCEVEQVIDFGHAPIFPDADAFPSIVVVRKLPAGDATARADVWAVQFPREELGHVALPEFVRDRGWPVPHTRFGKEPWSLEPPAVERLLEKMRTVGRPLAEVCGTKPYRGVLTGYNAAFMIDEATRDALIAEHPSSRELIKPYLRGRDVQRWVPDWDRQYMIFARRGVEIERYPAILRHLEQHRIGLEPKPKGWRGPPGVRWPGRKPGSYAWYEIQDSVDYYEQFEVANIVYTDITWRASFARSEPGQFCNNSAYLLGSSSAAVLATLNSPLMWWYHWREAQHGKDEALRLFSEYMVTVPLVQPDSDGEAAFERLVQEAAGLASAQQATARGITDWLRVEYDILKPGNKLSAFADLDTPAFLAEVKKRRPKGTRLGPSDVAALSGEHRSAREAWQQRAGRIAAIERELSTMVMDAFQLTDEERTLVRATAPPRMPPGLD